MSHFSKIVRKELRNYSRNNFQEIEQNIKTLRGKATPVLMITNHWGGEADSVKSDTLQHPNLLMLLLMFIIKLRENLSIKKSEILLLQKLSDSKETRKWFQ